MTGFRCWGLPLLALAIVVQAGRSQDPAPSWRTSWGKMEKNQATPSGTTCIQPVTVYQPASVCFPCSPCKPAAVDSACAIYSLESLGDDPSLGQWVATTI